MNPLNRLIDEWHKAYRYLSVQLAALLAIAATAWEFLPQLQPYLDPKWVKYAALAMILARVIRQTPKPAVDAPDVPDTPA